MRTSLSAGGQRAYTSWQSMRQRCGNPKAPDYPNYGGRGISYHVDWEIFEFFLRDMGERPEGMSLDRINNDDHYYKENCRWADAVTQRNNQRKQTEARSDSRTSIRGVSWERISKRYKVEVRVEGSSQTLYRGRDFFEACCAKKSWESSQRN